MEAEKNTRLAIEKKESERKEKERIAKIEADRIEKERTSKMEADRKETERKAKMEAERKERERKAKMEAEKKEKERLLKLETERKEKEIKEQKAEQERKKQEAAKKSVGKKSDPLRLPKPVDYEDYWYEGEDGLSYNEYDDELEQGYYYEGTEADPARASDGSLPASYKGIPRPTDYDKFWYEGDDGEMYNEYDDELEEGQFYEDPVIVNGAIEKVVTDINIVNNNDKKALDNSSQQKVDAKAAEEAAKAAADASKKLLQGVGGGLINSKTKPDVNKNQAGFGLGGLGGLFGNKDQVKQPTKLQEIKTTQKPPDVKKAPLPQPIPKPQEAKPSEKPKKEATAAELAVKAAEKPETCKMTARQRWKWAYKMTKKVKNV